MTIEVETKDCTALTDSDLAELADMGAGTDIDFGVGHLSKAKEDWVLSTVARIDGKMHGFMFSTLERIGGTPCVLLGLVSIKKNSRRDAVMKGLMSEAYHRALMAFPDEDVVIGTRFVTASGFEAFKPLTDIVPRPGHKAVGEERAWGRRLAKRFGVDGTYDEQVFIAKGQGSLVSHFDHDSLKPEKLDADVVALFKGMKPAKGDVLIACGWVMAENLLKLGNHS
jgi:predicted GNAT family N-acyltransferase